MSAARTGFVELIIIVVVIVIFVFAGLLFSLIFLFCCIFGFLYIFVQICFFLKLIYSTGYWLVELKQLVCAQCISITNHMMQTHIGCISLTFLHHCFCKVHSCSKAQLPATRALIILCVQTNFAHFQESTLEFCSNITMLRSTKIKCLLGR